MFVYWGGHDSGKKHMKQYAIHNDKTVLIWHQGNTGEIIWGNPTKNITKIYTTVHYQGVHWRDETHRKIVYHYNNGFRKCEKKTNSIYQHIPSKHKKSSINSIDDSTTYYELKRKRNYTKDEIKKYSQIEYINTNLYFDMLKYIDEDIPRKMFDYDEIFKDVDLVTLPPPEYVIQDNVRLFQSSINVIPYKSNRLDSIISKLDNFLSSRDNDLLETYNSDKNILWNYLDEYKRQQDNVIDFLKKYERPYLMFDLDTDSYKDTFGWEIELPRDYTHRKNSWKDNERYAMIQDIAKEYLQR